MFGTQHVGDRRAVNVGVQNTDFGPFGGQRQRGLTAVLDFPTPPLPELTATMLRTPLMPAPPLARFSVVMSCFSFQSMAEAPVTRNSSGPTLACSASKPLCRANGIVSSICSTSSSNAQ